METDLLPNSMCLSHHCLDVTAFWSLLQHELLNLHLQLSVGLLQGAHLIQVVGQPVVQALHCLLIVSVGGVVLEAGAQHVEAVAQRDGAGQVADRGRGFGQDAAPTVPHGRVRERLLTQGIVAHRLAGNKRHGVHCRRIRWRS